MRAEIGLPLVERSIKRRCGTCLHFQKAPLPGQGWCRNRELRSEHERALVSRGDYRCIEMLEDFWEPAEELRRRENQEISVAVANLGAINLPPVKRQYIYAVILSTVLLISAVFLFSTNVLSTPVVSTPTKESLAAIAKQDFWLRDDATSAIPSVIYIGSGNKLELIDSKAGEIIDSSLPSPAKWYKLRVVSSGDIGWAYSGWIERQ